MLRYALPAAALALLLVVGLVVRAGANDRIEGTWVVDAGAVALLDEFKDASALERETVRRILEATDLELTFSSDLLTCRSRRGGDDRTLTASYDVVSRDERSWLLEIETDAGTEEAVVEFAGDHLILGWRQRRLPLRRP